MRLLLTRNFGLLRRQGCIPCAKHAIAESAKSDANRRLFSSFIAAWLPPGVQQKRSSSAANGIAPVGVGGGRLLLKSSCYSVLVPLRTYRDGDRGSRPPGDDQGVAVSSEIWRLLQEYGVPATIRREFDVHIQATRTSSKEAQLTLRGRKAREVATMLADPPRKLDVSEGVSFWLTAKGPSGPRVIDIRSKSGALVQRARDKKSVLLVGPSEAILAAKDIIEECDYVGEVDIDNFVGFYLVNNDGFHLKRLGVETGALISPKPVVGATKWKTLMVGPTQSVELLKRKLAGLHIKRRRVPQAVCWWLTSQGKGVKCARSLDLDRKFNTYVHTGVLTDDNDPARTVDLVVTGQREPDVHDVLAIIDECCIEEFDIDNFVGFYLINNRAFHQKRLGVETDALISAKPVEGATKWIAVIVGPKESIKLLKSRLGGLHVERLHVPEAVCQWLTNPWKAGKCSRSIKLEGKFDTCISMGQLGDYKDPARMVDVAVVGDLKENVDGVCAAIAGLHIKRRRLPQAVCWWLTSQGKGVKCARSLDLDRKFNTQIYMGQLTDRGDPARMVDLMVVGEREADLDDVLAIIDKCCIEEFDIDNFVGFYLINNDAHHQKRLGVETDALITAEPVEGATKWKAVMVGPKESIKLLKSRLDGLHIERRRVPKAVYGWLTNPGKNVKGARSSDLERKFDTCIELGSGDDDNDPASMVDLAVGGERKENVAHVCAIIANTVVEKVNISKLQQEFWMGHEDELNRTRPHHMLENDTDTYIGLDEGASCMHVVGRPEDVVYAMDRIRKSQHIKLMTGPAEISLAAGNYIAMLRRELEDDNLQIHLRYIGMRPGTCELRRLHRVDREEDEGKADEADREQMKAIDLHEAVLHLPEWALSLARKLKPFEQRTTCGLSVTKDVINGGRLLIIAGSRTTVKRGKEAVIRLITSDQRYRVGDIRLRRIKGQSVDTAGFEKAGPIGEEDLSNCEEPFDWERLTREHWRYVGRPPPPGNDRRSSITAKR